MQDLMSSTNSIIVQVVDSCTCTDFSPKDACCTNITHFNLDFHALERLAHPDYGLMNLMFRSGVCISAGWDDDAYTAV